MREEEGKEGEREREMRLYSQELTHFRTGVI